MSDAKDTGLRIPERDFFSTKEAADTFGMSQSFIEKLVDTGALFGLSHCAGKGERRTSRIPRVALVTYWIRAAGNCPDSLAHALVSCLPKLTDTQLRNLRSAIDRNLGSAT